MFSGDKLMESQDGLGPKFQQKAAAIPSGNEAWQWKTKKTFSSLKIPKRFPFHRIG
jgi:hypothetical protein